MANALYFRDNLEVLREPIEEESVDLVYKCDQHNARLRLHCGTAFAEIPKREERLSGCVGQNRTRTRPFFS